MDSVFCNITLCCVDDDDDDATILCSVYDDVTTLCSAFDDNVLTLFMLMSWLIMRDMIYI